MTDPLRIIIADDETPARNRLRELLADCAASFPHEVVGEATNGREALELMSRVPADLLLLDIRMPEMDGIEVARHLLRLPQMPSVIFTTAYDLYAIQAFEVNAVDYLLKPVRSERLLAALQKAGQTRPPGQEQLQKLARRPRSCLSVQERGKIVLIPIGEIIFLKAEQKYVTIRTHEREYLLEESLTNLEQEFAVKFIRIHRNCLVAKDSITGFEKVAEDSGEAHWEVVLKGVQEKLPVSRRQQYIVKEFAK
ncbi:MAG TPA: LytTR family DNA-binding domain-containing protein [Burkholderiales bacterium]|nr:LytTR family DNA-binding domain-containing protein [Burkholderiales bacterium]